MIQTISDNLAFKALQHIKHGQLKLTNYDGEKIFVWRRKKKFKCRINN